MADSKIEWTDKTWNPITGCSKISEGCRYCYAEKMAHRLAGRFGYPRAPNEFDVTFHADRLERPLHWHKPRAIFVCSMGDFFHEEVGWNWQTKIFGIMRSCPQHTFLILTKRPRRMKDFPFYPWDWPFPNVWLGVTAENQEAAEERIPILLETPATVQFVSCEPLLGPIDLTDHLFDSQKDLPFMLQTAGDTLLDWIIVGGESGPNARPMHPTWARRIKDDCVAAHVPFFFKQWGAWSPNVFHYIEVAGKRNRRPRIAEINWPGWKKCRLSRVGKKAAGRLLDGREWNELPEKTKHGQ